MENLLPRAAPSPHTLVACAIALALSAGCGESHNNDAGTDSRMGTDTSTGRDVSVGTDANLPDTNSPDARPDTRTEDVPVDTGVDAGMDSGPDALNDVSNPDAPGGFDAGDPDPAWMEVDMETAECLGFTAPPCVGCHMYRGKFYRLPLYAPDPPPDIEFMACP